MLEELLDDAYARGVLTENLLSTGICLTLSLWGGSPPACSGHQQVPGALYQELPKRPLTGITS